ncbi:hypothetical protein VNO80_29574 [Phaseolus coccineus]|uniref:PPC domain-containing protein n=1 Tax=Phaseolus coccineus TaxID=3886 RepID=A0AAN9LBK7_PHACN
MSVSEEAMNMPTMRRPRGRPIGSKNKPKPAPLMRRDTHNVIESHMIEITSGADITYNLVQFARRKERGFCVLSAIGSIRNVTLQQSLIPDTIMTLEGQLQILSLRGSFLPGATPPTLSVYLAGAKGQVVGGKVVGPLVASGTVFIILAAFSNAAFDRLPGEASSSNHHHHNDSCPSNLP